MKNEHWQQWKDLVTNKDYSAANVFLLSVAKEYQDDQDYLYCFVNTSRKLGYIDRAKNVCKKALLKYPDSSQLNFEMGIIYQTKGEHKKAIEHLNKSIQTAEHISDSQIVDALNSIALTYKMDGDFENAIKNYNLAIGVLAREIHTDIKNNPLRYVNLVDKDFDYTGEKMEGWVDMAIRIALSTGVNDGVEAVRFPTGETAQRIAQENSVIDIAIYDDEDRNRYMLPAYFSSFYLALKSSIVYSSINNNLGVLFAETGKIDKAKKCFEEAIRFIPKGIDYKNPIINLEELEKTLKKTGTKFYVVPQTEEEIEHNRNKIEELRAKGLLKNHEKTFQILKDGSVIEAEEEIE